MSKYFFAKYFYFVDFFVSSVNFGLKFKVNKMPIINLNYVLWHSNVTLLRNSFVTLFLYCLVTDEIPYFSDVGYLSFFISLDLKHVSFLNSVDSFLCFIIRSRDVISNPNCIEISIFLKQKKS